VLGPEKTWKSHLDESTSAGEKVFAVILQLLSFRIISGDYRVEEKSFPFGELCVRASYRRSVAKCLRFGSGSVDINEGEGEDR
jgi:hypothetical protein